MLSFLHVSDIHFDWQYASGDPYERNADIRNELKEDVARLVEVHGRLDGILVGGDVAYRGAASEFDRASEWLEELAAICGCERSSVWVVPGNHDVDRQVVDSSRTLKWYRERLRGCELDHLDSELKDILHDDPAGSSMFEPFANYNAFAEAFDCAVSSEYPFWREEFELSEGKSLLLQGVTSPLVSDSDDGETHDKNKLVLGSFQARVLRERNRPTIVLCHHPPAWLRDGESVNAHFVRRTQVQLYGHIHDLAVEEGDNTLAITAGAVNPEYGPGWEPRYNFLQFEWDDEGEGASLGVRVFARTWLEGEEAFGPDPGQGGNEGRSFRLRLETPAGLPAAPVAPQTSLDPVHVDDAQGGERRLVSPVRELLYRFSMLPYARRLVVAEELGLIEDEDRSVDDVELHKRIFMRARERGGFPALWDAVSTESHDVGPNPFSVL